MSAIVLFAIVPLFALLLVGAVADRQIAIRSASLRAIDRARLGAAWQDDGFQHGRDVLNVLRRLLPTMIDDPVTCHATLEQIAAQYPQFTSIGFVDTGNMVRCLNLRTTPIPFQDEGVALAAQSADPSSLLIGRFAIGPITGKPLVALAESLPPDDAGKRPGFAYVTLDLDWAARHALDFAGSANDTVSLIDTRDATILARSPDQRHFAGTKQGVDVLAGAIRDHAGGGSVEAEDIDHVQKVFGFAPLGEGAGLVVAVGVPRNAILADANQRLVIGVACAVVAALMAAVMAWLFTDRTQVRAIRALVDAASKVGAGDLSARATMEAWQAPEFRTLSETLAGMAVSLASSQMDLTASEQQLRLLADHSTDMIIRVREGGKRLYVSPACRKLTGWEPAEMLALTSQDTIHPDDVAYVSDPRLFAETPFVFTYRMRRKDGRYIWVEASARGLPTAAGEPPECILVVRDAGQRVEAEHRLRESEARYRLLEEQGTDMVFQLDRDFVRRYVSPASFEILGLEPSELVGTKPVGMVHPEDADRVASVFHALMKGQVERTAVVNRIQHRDGRWVWVEAQLKAMRSPEDGCPTGIIGSLRDITVRKAAEERLEEANRRLEALAQIDGLTGLPNRRSFDTALERERKKASAGNLRLGLVMIDVDHFKLFNDRYGHVAGDECLRRVSRAIESVLYRPSDTAARYGGEEFVVLLPDTDEAGAALVAERIRRAVLDITIANDRSPTGLVSISAGAASSMSADAAGDANRLVMAADRALYRAKSGGRNAVALASALPEHAHANAA